MRQSQEMSSAFSRLLKCLRSLYGKNCGPRSDCSYRSSLFWVYAVCFYTKFVSNIRQLFAADDFSRRHFQMHFFLGALRVNLFGHLFQKFSGFNLEETTCSLIWLRSCCRVCSLASLFLCFINNRVKGEYFTGRNIF